MLHKALLRNGVILANSFIDYPGSRNTLSFDNILYGKRETSYLIISVLYYPWYVGYTEPTHIHNLLIAHEILSPEFIDPFQPLARYCSCRIQTCLSGLSVGRPQPAQLVRHPGGSKCFHEGFKLLPYKRKRQNVK